MACYALLVAASLLAASGEIVVAGQAPPPTVRLKTRDSDGAALCAQEDRDAPSRYAPASARMSSAPAAVACGMTCTGDQRCRHFNYVSTDPARPCHLYYYSPTHFDVQPNCIHYETPGKSTDATAAEKSEGTSRWVSGGARVFAARGKRLCCRRPPPLIRSAIDILMGTGTTMALVWTVNSTLILECNCDRNVRRILVTRRCAAK